jgi:hypothetical protein
MIMKGDVSEMILFCEYVVPEIHRGEFAAWAAGRKELWEGAELMENADQPGVFVEIWKAPDEGELARMKKERLEGRSEWREMERWIKGGRSGLRVWVFRSVNPE